MIVPKGVLALRRMTEDGSRYALHALRLERLANGMAKAVVSDGKCIVIAQWDDAGDRIEFPDIAMKTDPVAKWVGMIPNDTVDQIVKNMPKKPLNPILDNIVVEEGAAPDAPVRLGTTSLSTKCVLEARQCEGHFPPYEEIVDKAAKKDATFRYCLDVERLRDIVKVLYDAHGDKGSSVRLEFTTEDEAVRVSVASGPLGGVTSFSMLMPISGNWPKPLKAEDKAERVVKSRDALKAKCKSQADEIRMLKLRLGMLDEEDGADTINLPPVVTQEKAA